MPHYSSIGRIDARSLEKATAMGLNTLFCGGTIAELAV